MRGMIRMATIFLVSLAIAKLIAALLNTRPARRLAQNAGAEALLTSEGKDVVQRYSRSAASLILGTVMGRRVKRWEGKTGSYSPRAGWPGTLDDAAEILSAGGALARIVADFCRERLELENRTGPGASRGKR